MNEDLQVQPTTTETKKEKNVTLDGQGLKELVVASLTWLKTNQHTVNALNVFPVPDGDTGTNMVLTMQSAYKEISNSGEKNIGRMAQAIAQGSLLGARGNSGVILSQFWRGFARTLDHVEIMDSSLLVRALLEARNTAYKGVVQPVEGTILTVGNDLAIAAENALNETNDMLVILEKIVIAADQSVKRTPDLLPILKQAGVVDAGGKGLFLLLEGMLRHLNSQPLETPITSVQPLSIIQMEETIDTIEPGQDFEVVLDFRPNESLNLETYYHDLSQMGTSIQVGEGDGMYRMHIHVPAENRYAPIDYTMGLGTITKVYIENLLAQMDDIEQAKISKQNLAIVEPSQIAVVAVSPGIGISRIFASLGVAAIVEGGQTMNPSTKDILKSFENLPTDKIIILPNNKNIVMASQAVVDMTVKHVVVIPSTTIPQGLSALLYLLPNGDFEQIVRDMNDALKDVETGEITTATRSVEINGVTVKKGEVIALHNGKLIQAAKTLEDACLGLLESVETDKKERITLFYGSNITKSEVNGIVDKIRSRYSTHEFEIHEGGQPHYQFIIAIE